MQIDLYIQRIQYIDQLIRKRATGPPAALAEELGISPSMVFEYLDFMRKSGAPIFYSKKKKTYYYLYEVEFNYGFRLVQEVKTRAKTMG